MIHYVWALLVILFFGRDQVMSGARSLGDALFHLGEGWRPVGDMLMENCLRSAGSLALCIVLLVVSDIVGLRLIRFFIGSKSLGFIRITAPFAGYAIISLLVLGAAATGLCYREIIFSVALSSFLFLRREFFELVRNMKELIVDLRHEHKLAVGGLVLLIACWIPRLVLPEINEDCLMYHLTLPQHLISQHRVPGPPYHTTWAYPLLSDFPNVFAVSLGLDASVRQIHLVFAWLGAMALLRVFVRELPYGWTALLALAALLVPSGSV